MSTNIELKRVAMDSSFDAYNASPTQPYTRPTKRRIGELFICGPVPVRWFKDAHEAGSAAFSITPVLWFWNGLKGDEFELNLSRLKLQWGISRQTAGRGLKDLEEAGLVQVHRVNGRKSKIKMFKTKLREAPDKHPT